MYFLAYTGTYGLITSDRRSNPTHVILYLNAVMLSHRKMYQISNFTAVSRTVTDDVKQVTCHTVTFCSVEHGGCF
jgi:hypothetical protein